MNRNNLLEKVKEAGFKSLDDFVKANLHYLSKDNKKLFYCIIGFNEEIYNAKVNKKSYYKTNY